MKKISIALLCLSLVAAMLCGVAEAKRMGGGGSFGGRPSYSRSYSAPAPGYNPAAPTRQVSPQTAPTPTPTPGPTPGTAAPGMGSRFGWGLGGFMAGGLLGSMLFGHGMGGGWGGGMGGGIGLLDIVLIGLVIWLVVRFISRRGSAQNRTSPSDLRPGQERRQPPPSAPPDDQMSRAEHNWDGLRSQPQQPAQPAAPSAPPAGGTGGFGVAPGSEAPQAPVVPEGFNVAEFLEGAKTVYARLQHSWDRRDLNDIALFTTPEVLAELKRQAAADPSPSKTELLLVNARLLEFREEDKDTVVSVLFDVLMREDVSEEHPKQVREVWHFSRPTGDQAANWRLEGIQQLEG
jgi:predicted lipid-binding transport protein (Tim44 family)